MEQLKHKNSLRASQQNRAPSRLLYLCNDKESVREGLNCVSYMGYVMTAKFIRCVFSRRMLERVQFRTGNCRPRYFLTMVAAVWDFEPTK